MPQNLPHSPADSWVPGSPLRDVLPVLRASLGVGTVPADLNIARAAHAARAFNVVPAVFHAGQRADLDCPSGIVDALQEDMTAITRNNLVLAMELLRLGGALEAEGVSYLTFKGAANAVVLYGDLSHRRCGDIDLIVPVDAFEKAEEVLARTGFQFVRRYDNSLQASFRQQKSQATIDLHWGVPPRALELKPEPLWLCQQRIKVLNGEVNTLDPEGILILLAINCSKEPWNVSLHQAYDLAWLLVYPPRALDWPRVGRIARKMGATRLVNVGVSLARTVFALPPGCCPENIVENFREKKQVLGELLHAVQQVDVDTEHQLPSPVAFQRWTQYYDAVHATELLRNWRVLRRVFTVTDADRQWVRLPAAMSGCYVIIRPLRLAAQRLCRGKRL